MSKLYKAIAFIPLFFFLISPVLLATQTTYTFYPVADSYIKDNGKNENEGLATNLRLQHPDRSSHVLLKFSQSDLLATIGTAQLISANLKLYVETNFNNWGSGSNVDAHRMTADWQEYISGNPPQGVTWNCPLDINLDNANPNCSTQWNGGLYNSSPLDSIFHQNNQTGWKTFNVLSDLQAIQNGSITHYGWLVRKSNSGSNGSVDYTSIQGSGTYKPRLEVVVVENSPPTVTCSPSPISNSNGWNNTNVTVTCSCIDSDGISSCTPTQQLTNEGAGQIVICQATDTLGATSSCSVTINIDKTAPSIFMTSPTNGEVLNTCQPLVTGTLSIGGSAISSVICNDFDGTFSMGSYSCQPTLANGAETILVQATDLADNVGSASISVTNTTTNSIITIDSTTPVIGAVGDPDSVAINGTGFDENMLVYLDGSQISYTYVNETAIFLDTNFSSQAVHSLEIKKPSSCPEAATILDPGVLSVSDGQILVYPESTGPNGGESISIFGNQGSFEPGAAVYIANPNSNCSAGKMRAQAATYVDDKRLDIITPLSSVGDYDLLVDNPIQQDLCKTSGLSFIVLSPEANNDSRYSCCQSVPPPTSLSTNQVVTVKLRVKNTGTSPWRKNDGIRLGSYWQHLGSLTRRSPIRICGKSKSVLHLCFSDYRTLAGGIVFV